MKYYSRTVKNREAAKGVACKLLEMKVSYVMDTILSGIDLSREFTVKIEERRKLNLAIHYSSTVGS